MGREKEMDVLGEWEKRVGCRHDQDTLSTHMELSKKKKFKVMLLPQMSMNKRLNPVPWDSLQGFSCLLWCFHAGFSVRSLRPASCTPTMLVSISQPSWDICAHWHDFLISFPVLTQLHGLAQLLFSVHSHFSQLSPFLSCQPWLSHPLLGCALHMSEAGFQVWTSTSQLSPKA